MGYQQHNSPFRGTYSNPTGTTNNPNTYPDLTQGLVMPNNVTAEGEDVTVDETNSDANSAILNQPDDISAAASNIRATATMDSKMKKLHNRANNKSLSPTNRGRARRHEILTEAKNARTEKKWDLKNKLTEDKVAKSNPEKLNKIEERQANRRARALKNDKINPETLQPMPIRSAKNIANNKPRQGLTSQYGGQLLDDFEVTSDSGGMSNSALIGALGNAAKHKMNQPNMKQINSRGSAFPMVNPDGVDPTAIPPNRAGGALAKNELIPSPSSVQPGIESAAVAAQKETIGQVASNVGTATPAPAPAPVGAPLPTNDNSQDQIAQAQANLGTDAATNTDVPAMGGAGMGMHGPAKKDWIGPVTENMDQSKPCTGSKKGGPTCPPGSKKFELANTLLKLSKKRKK